MSKKIIVRVGDGVDKKMIIAYLLGIIAVVIVCFALNGNKPKSVIDKTGDIDFKVDGNYLKWRNNDDAWKVLYDLSLLEGKDGKDGLDGKNGFNGLDGVNGKDGREVEFFVENKILYWRYVGDEEWIKLLDFNEKVSNETQSSLVTSVNGSTKDFGCLVNGKTCAVGTEMTIKVNDEEIYPFYVIDDTNGVLNLISASNIGNSSVNTLKWYESSKGDTSNGPTTLLKTLNTLTVDWKNINYIKDYSYINTGSGYQKLSILNGVITIKDSGGNDNLVSGLARTRLLTKEEVLQIENLDDDPKWLYGNMDGESYTLRPYGYWLLTTASTAGKVYNMRNTGVIASNSAADASGRGLRPVISIKK